jgi:hypothetical protein
MARFLGALAAEHAQSAFPARKYISTPERVYEIPNGSELSKRKAILGSTSPANQTMPI